MGKNKVVYLGNRDICYKVIRNNPKYEIVKIFTFADCALSRLLDEGHIDYERINEKDNEYVVQMLSDLQYDILVVNGCPFILPASRLKNSGKLLLNTHPTYLPYMRGRTPINGCLLYGYPLGATTHFISDKIDAGNIIYQEKVDLTPDLDLGLCYYISFSMEERVFRRALELLEESNFQYNGIEMDTSKHPIFINHNSLREINLQKMSAEDCTRHIRAYGLEGEGCFAQIDGERCVVYDAEEIINKYLLEKSQQYEEGQVMLRYGSNILIKCHEGVLKIKNYRKS